MRVVCALVLLCGAIAINIEAETHFKIMKNKEPYSVTVRGQVASVEINQLPPSGVSIDVKLKLELINDGQKPVIFLKDKAPILVGYVLTKSSDNVSPANQLAFSFTGPGVDTSPEWASFRKSLDQPFPPSDNVRILMPNETWRLDDTVRIFLSTEAGNKSASPQNASWEVVQKLSPVWLRIIFQAWPLSLESPKRDRSKLMFGRKLQHQWKREGLLWLEALHSHPIELNLRDSKR